MSYVQAVNELTNEMLRNIIDIVRAKNYIDLEPYNIYVSLQDFPCIADKVIALRLKSNGNILIELGDDIFPLHKLSMRDMAQIADVLKKL